MGAQLCLGCTDALWLWPSAAVDNAIVVAMQLAVRHHVHKMPGLPTLPLSMLPIPHPTHTSRLYLCPDISPPPPPP
jgi:hypothetical protein